MIPAADSMLGGVNEELKEKWYRLMIPALDSVLVALYEEVKNEWNWDESVTPLAAHEPQQKRKRSG
jgi:hypothetical protein